MSLPASASAIEGFLVCRVQGRGARGPAAHREPDWGRHAAGCDTADRRRRHQGRLRLSTRPLILCLAERIDIGKESERSPGSPLRQIGQGPGGAVPALRSGSEWIDLYLVCDRGDGGAHDPDQFTKNFKKLAAKAGLHPDSGLHDVRHAVATALLERGVDTAITSRTTYAALYAALGGAASPSVKTGARPSTCLT